MELVLTSVDPADAGAVEAAAGLIRAADAVDAPWWPSQEATQLAVELRHGWDGEAPRVFLVHADGVLVGLGRIDASDWDNTELAWLGVQVDPDHRRRGHGTAVLERLTAIALAEGRPLLGLDGWDGPVAHGFAERAGYTERSVDVVRRHDLSPGAVERAARLAEQAAGAAASYDLERYPGAGPEEILPALAELTAAINDAPTDDLEIEDEVYPPERVRGYEQATLAGHRMYRLVARHRETGELAGHSVVAVEAARPAIGWQHDTSVVPAHRGHRLGLLLKAAMVGWLAEDEPELRQVFTFNAASNDPMIAVNDDLGHVEAGRVVQFQRRAVSDHPVDG